VLAATGIPEFTLVFHGKGYIDAIKPVVIHLAQTFVAPWIEARHLEFMHHLGVEQKAIALRLVGQAKQFSGWLFVRTGRNWDAQRVEFVNDIGCHVFLFAPTDVRGAYGSNF